MTWDPQAWTAAFVTAVAETLADADVAFWNPAQTYAQGLALPVTYAATMPAAGTQVPVRAVSLTPYLIDDTADEHIVQGLQVRSRGTANPFDALGIDDSVRHVLHRPQGLVLGTTDPARCPLSKRRNAVAGVVLDPTGKAREAVSNYEFVLPRASVDPWS